jgi:outer membrane receptor for ferrienterochelin and colicin
VTGIPAGTYEVKVQYLGYGPQTQAGVVVTGGKTTTVNFRLTEVVVREEKVVEVTGERRLVEVRQGATIRSATAQEIRNLPVQSITDVLQQQAGITAEEDQIHVRGGRSDETVFVVNGVSNRDLVTGQSTAGRLNARSVAEVNVATGAYDVRYGNALSGVVEVKLKEGGDALSGGLTVSNGSYGIRTFQGVVGGPIVKGQVSGILDVSGSLDETRYRVYTDGENVGFFSRLTSAPDHPRLESSYEDQIFGKKFRYGDFFTPSQDNLWSLRTGLSWKPSTRDKISFNFSKRIEIDQGFSRSLISVTNDSEPAFPWRWQRNIAHAPTFFEDNVQSSIEWRRTLSATGFTTFQISRYYQALRRDVMGKMWWEYEQPDDFGNFPVGDPRRDTYFIDSGDDDTWQDRRTNTVGLQWSLTQRVQKRHDLEVGFDHQFQTVQYVTIEKPWEFDPEGLGSSHDLWEVHPMVGNLYVRDRLEYEGFTANVGLRADYWFIGEEAEDAVADPNNTNISDATREGFYNDTKSIFGRRAKVIFSPRIIVAHPITEQSSFFFNYGVFTQLPSYRYVYSKLQSVSSESFPLLGNPNLNPQVSVNYEVGGKHQFHEAAAVNATFFVKDVYDYPSATTFKRTQGTSLVDIFVYLNGHYARSKGFEVQVEKRRRDGYWSGKLTYSFQQTKGKSSDPNEQQVVERGGGDAAETRLSEAFVRWNRPHKLSANLDFRFHERTPEGWEWLRDTGLNLYIQGQSGRSYTPISIYSIQAAEPNSENAPFQLLFDLKLNHAVSFYGQRFDFAVIGNNIFDNQVIQRVDATTGHGIPYMRGYYTVPLATGGEVSYRADDPSNYGTGAVWRLSLDYDF